MLLSLQDREQPEGPRELRIRKNKEGTTQAVEAVEHLRNARAALVELRNQLSEM